MEIEASAGQAQRTKLSWVHEETPQRIHSLRLLTREGAALKAQEGSGGVGSKAPGFALPLRPWPSPSKFSETRGGTSVVVQRLRLCASNAGDTGSTPGRGTKIPHAQVVWPKA